MTDHSPLVSIGMPVYNGAGTLAAAIRSIINQTYQNWELLIMDDGSTDGSEHIAASFGDPRIRVVKGGDNRGIVYRLNEAVRLAQGDYFARMDADDIAFPQRIKRQVSYLNKHSEISLIGAQVLVFSGDGVVKGSVPVRSSHEEIVARPWMGFCLAHPTWMGRRHWFLANPYDHSANGAEDQQLLFRTRKSIRFACLKEVLLGYREENRTLNKLWARRRCFLKGIVPIALRTDSVGLAIMIVAVQLAKMASDFGHSVLGTKLLRNRMLTLDESTLQQWSDVWLRCREAQDSRAEDSVG